jgi:Predicted nucleotide-binding protein containing TIR-like domain
MDGSSRGGIRAPSPTDQEQINLTSSEFIEEESLEIDRLQLIRLLALLRVEPVTRGSGGPHDGEPVWQVTVDDSIRTYGLVASASDYFEFKQQMIDAANQRAAPWPIDKLALEAEGGQLAVGPTLSIEPARRHVDPGSAVRDHESVALSSRTIARLSRPFEGGNGPTHGSIERVWLSEDASAYLPDGGNKAERVRGGLRALRDGVRHPGGEPLPLDLEKLNRVAEELAAMLVSGGLVKEEDVLDALDATFIPSAPEHGDETANRPTPATRSPTSSGTRGPPDPAVSVTAPIFLVHGHDHGLLHQVVRVLERATSREVIVLHEQANRGRTVLEKFEEHAQVASFAVVLLTADDVGGAAGQKMKPRGRQNVIFELGFFFGKLGRERVCVLLEDGVEQPSDMAGLVYVAADAAGSWKYSLTRELHAAGIDVAFDRIP